HADALMQRVHDIAVHADRENCFDDAEVIVSAGGSAIFDLVTKQLKPRLSRPVRGLLRSGCYITHDHSFYKRMVSAVTTHLRCDGVSPVALQVGDLVSLGISHPCTTFDKWRWLPVVDDRRQVVDALVTCF